ncbi:MAG: NfeD family protein [Bryobacteraceae bacterium]
MDPLIPWWLWTVLGLALMGLEILAPTGFFLFFFGVGAVVTGFLAAMGFADSLVVQGLALLAVSAGTLYLFRKPLMATFHLRALPAGVVDSMVGETAISIGEIPAGGYGKVELRGSSWSAQNLGTEPIPASARCRVEEVRDLTLFVRL